MMMTRAVDLPKGFKSELNKVDKNGSKILKEKT